MTAPDPVPQDKSEATKIALWCEKQYEEEEAIANTQIRLVQFTVLAGIFLLLALPRLIYEIDYLLRTDSLPKNIIENAQVAQDILNNQQQEINNQVMNAMTRLDSMKIDLDDAKGILEEREKQLNVDLARDLALFWHIPDTDSDLTHVKRKVIKTQNDSFIAIGFQNILLHELFEIKRALRLLRSADGLSWTPIPLVENGMEMLGDLHFLIQADDGTFIATGREDASDKSETVLLLRSSDGETWSPIRPEEHGEKLKGSLLSIMQVRDASFIATGFELADNNTVTMLLLRSSDGETWSPIRPEEHGEKLKGRLLSIMQARDASFIAAGFERADDDTDTILLLRSFDGETWTPVRPEEHNKKLSGHLNFIMQAKDDSFIAAGFESYLSSEFRQKLLLLRSIDGISWMPIRIEVDDDNISGYLNSVHQLTDGKFIAIGNDITKVPLWSVDEQPNIREITETRIFDSFATQFTATALLLHSSDGISWIPVPLFKNNRRLIAAHENLFLPDESSGFSFRVSNSWLKNFDKGDAKSIRAQIKKELEVSSDLVTSSNIWPLLDGISVAQHMVKNLNENFTKQDGFYNKIKVSSENQLKATETFTNVTKELDQALHKTELIREGGQIATRIAIVGLLIYLVQILVNRYRYHLRLAKFYKARAQALRLIIGNTEQQSAFSNASLSDLAMALSPESIQFDKLSSQSLIYSNQANDGKVS